jgi:DNA-binding MarR family transcriptional regulator
MKRQASHAASRRPRPAPGKLKRADYRTLAQFRYLLRKFAGFSEEAARAEGLTSRSHQALLAIHGHPAAEPVTVGALSERLNIRHHSAVGLVDRLAARRLVRRRRDSEDARRVCVDLRREGLVLLARLSRVHRDELRRIGPTLRRLLHQVGR